MHVEDACPTHARPHQLEWKLTPPVKAGDNTLKQRVCFGLQRGPRLYFRQRGDRRQRQREREQKHAHTLLTPSVKEIQGALEARSGGTLMSRSMNKHKINAGTQDVGRISQHYGDVIGNKADHRALASIHGPEILRAFLGVMFMVWHLFKSLAGFYCEGVASH